MYVTECIQKNNFTLGFVQFFACENKFYKMKFLFVHVLCI